MKKCKSCGAVNEDEVKFCSECGAPLSAGEGVCPSCGAKVPEGTKFCPECGAHVVPAEQPAAEQPAPETTPDATADASTEADGTKEAAPQKGGKVGAKIAAAKAKTLAFESKHGIIVNALVILFSIVIALVALLAPIKVMAYTTPVSDSESETERVGHYVEIDQSIWNMFGAIGYLSFDITNESDVLKAEELMVEVEEAGVAAEAEFEEWALSHMDATEEEAEAKMQEIMSEHYSDVNYLAFLIVSNSLGGMAGGLENLPSDWLGIGGSARVSIIIGLVITALAIATAIVAVVFLIFAVLGMIKKSTKHSPFKLFNITLKLVTPAIILMSFAPLFKIGGGMFALMLVAAISYIALGVGLEFVNGTFGWALTIKRAVLSTLVLVATCLLATNVMAYINEVNMGEDASTITQFNTPSGYGFYAFFTMIDMEDITLPGGLEKGVIGSGVSGIFMTLLFIAFISCTISALISTLKTLVYGNVNEKADGDEKNIRSIASKNMMAGFVFGLIVILFGMIATPLFSNIDGIYSPEGGSVDIEGLKYVTKYTMRAQVWVSAIMLLVGFIFDKAFNPKKKEAKAEA